MKVKIKILICTGLMLNDHSNPYIESTTVLSDMVFHSFSMLFYFRFFLLNSSISITETPTNMKFCMYTYFITGMCTMLLYFR